MITAFIGIGSNLDFPEKRVQRALGALSQLEKTSVVKCSSLYASQPLGPQNQPGFINAVVMLDTELSAAALLSGLQTIENKQGRVRDGVRWGPRVIDLDLLLYGQQLIETDDLIVPHPGLKEREFVLYPLVEIAPDLILPSGESIFALKRACPERGLKCLKQEVDS